MPSDATCWRPPDPRGAVPNSPLVSTPLDQEPPGPRRFGLPAVAAAAQQNPDDALVRDLLRELIEIDTTARKPLLLIAHLDVVEANRADWSTDPFQFVEKDGWFCGRGTTDIKDGVAILVANFIRWQKEGYRPDRDLILALTANEETGGPENGVAWLLRNHRPPDAAGAALLSPAPDWNAMLRTTCVVYRLVKALSAQSGVR